MKLCINNAKIRQQEVNLLSSNPKHQLYKTIVTIFTVMLLTLLVGEVKIVPFEDTTFRFALGSIVFFLCILVLKVPILLTGFLTSLLIVPFRSGLSHLMYGANFYDQLFIHSPAAAFYIIYTLILALINIERLKQRPLLLIVYAAFAEVLANVGEQIANYMIFLNAHLLLRDILLLVVVAITRSLFVVGLYSLVSLNEQKKQTEQLLLIGSNLYTESLYVKKMMELIEGITQDSFKMHQALRQQDRQRAMEALMIAQNTHEVKKDLERVYAGLNKIVLAKQSNPYYFHDLLHLVIEANTRYSIWHQKQITFQRQEAQNFKTKEPFLLLSVMNNIVANAVEAIQQQGTITISSKQTHHDIQIFIENDGPAINPTLLDSIFDAGYTTKFNEQGVASTGIGLNHVKTMCEKLGGSVSVMSDTTTIFTITFPTYKLLR